MNNPQFSICTVGVVFATMVFSGPARAQSNKLPAGLEGVGIEEQLGERLPLDLEFIDSTGEKVVLQDYFNGDLPVILTLNYFSCPMLCTLQLNGMVKGLNEVDFNPGDDYQILTVSIDTKETTDLGAAKKRAYMKAMTKDGTAEGWSFLISPDNSVKVLADAVGFSYRWNDERNEWAHDSAIFIISPNGKITRYLYGIEFEPDDLRLALLEGGEGRIGTTIDRVILWCFHFDDSTGQYTLAVMNIMRVAGVVTVVLLGSVILILWKRDKIRRARRNEKKRISELAGAH